MDDGSGLQPVIIMMTLFGAPFAALVLLCIFSRVDGQFMGKQSRRVLWLFLASLIGLLVFAVYSYSVECGEDVIGRAGQADYASCAIGAYTTAPILLIGAALAALVLIAVWRTVEEGILRRR